ncbi:MAG: hypothetical protein ACSHW7_06475 [Patiriisocius sp.]|uniref:hypothetical protein n=1 Tax=Patiriisocius sp. TaxID=2822396 RepID=UPI003EF46650
MDEKLKHLEFIQNIITRMNTNSFQIKGMSVTLSAALLALVANTTNMIFIAIIYFTLFIFWGLDAYYLSQEKGYRNLYNRARKLSNEQIDFDLKLKSTDVEGNNSWQFSLTNKTIILLYLAQAILSLILIVLFKNLQ